MSLLNCVNKGMKTTNSEHTSSNQDTMDKKFKCLTWMLKLFTCGRGIDRCGLNGAPFHACINSTVLDAKPLSDRKSLLDDETLHGQRISSEDKQFGEEIDTPSHGHNSHLPVVMHYNDKILLEDKSLHDDSMPSGKNHFIHDNLLDNKIHENNLLLLPNDIIINILSRLSIKSDVLQCRRVCRLFFEIISTPFFATMNLNRATPILVLQPTQYCNKTCDCETKLYAYDILLHIIDEGNNRILTKKVEISLNYLPKKYSFVPDLIGSYNGLLLFKDNSEGAFFIINPITQEQVVVKGPPYAYEACGVYFHPPTSEYRILYVRKSIIKPPRFYILSLRAKSLREISNKTTVAPCTRKSPVILNGALHWMGSIGDTTKCRFVDSPGCSKSILVFNLESEEFITMSHPGSACCSKERQGANVQLLEMEGHLCLCDTSTSPAEVHVWVCENYREKVWIKRHIINIKSLISDPGRPNYHGWPNIEALRIHNDELLLKLCWRYLYYYNVKLQTLRKVERVSDALLHSVVVHYNSLASLQSESGISLADLKRCSTN